MSNNRDKDKPKDHIEEKPTQHPHGKTQPGENVKKPIQENPEDQNTG